jgi:hypothetical protein
MTTDRRMQQVKGRRAHVIEELPRVSSKREELGRSIGVPGVARGVAVEGLDDGHDEGGGDEAEEVVVDEGEVLRSVVQDLPSSETERKEESHKA